MLVENMNGVWIPSQRDGMSVNEIPETLIHRTWNEELHTYLTGIIQNKNHKMLVINTIPSADMPSLWDGRNINGLIFYQHAIPLGWKHTHCS